MLSYAQMGGWLKKVGKQVIKLAKSRAKAYIDSFSKMTQEAMKEQRPKDDYFKDAAEQSYGMAQTLQWNSENVSSQELKKHYKSFSNRNLFDLKSPKTPKTVTVRL